MVESELASAFISSETLAVYISVSRPSFMVEVYSVSFPRWNGSHCLLSTLVPWQKERFQKAYEVAVEVCARINADDRKDLTPDRVQKIFNRSWE